MAPLAQLLTALADYRMVGDPSRAVRGVAYDSRQARPGDLFVAVPGLRVDGAQFAREAVARGATAVVAECPDLNLSTGVPLVVVPDARRALGLLAAAHWGYPSRRLGVVGVTGTDGKTTTATLIAEIFEAAGLPTGLLSTVQVRTTGRPLANRFHCTTPEAPTIQRCLARMVRSEGRWAVLEVSSHGLALQRTVGCEIDVAVLTNLAPEHLDFHGTFEAYRAAKARLFEMLAAPSAKTVRRMGIVNHDDRHAAYFRAACPVDVLSYGIEQPADLRARDIHVGLDGTTFVVDSLWGTRRLQTPLVGSFNVYNWLAAIATGLGQGLGWEAIERATRRALPVRGRVQRIEAGQPFTVLVDFAHTPWALATVLGTCRQLTRGRVIVVCGHPGERFVDNRPVLGAVAVQGADLAIVTSDDPYGEPPEAIIESIVAGAIAAGGVADEHFVVVPDRRQAIRRAVQLAQPGDLVLIAGRGHLRYRVAGAQRTPFVDAQVVRQILRRHWSSTT